MNIPMYIVDAFTDRPFFSCTTEVDSWFSGSAGFR